MAQVVSRRHLTMEAQGRSQVTPGEIVVMVEEALGQVFLQINLLFPYPCPIRQCSVHILSTRCSDKKEYQSSFINPVAFDRTLL